jgi:hypothetical protein
MMKAFSVSLLAVFFLSTVTTFAAAPDCKSRKRPLPVNNDQILSWKATTENEFQDRGHIVGTLTKLYRDKTGHRHIQVQIGDGPTDQIEVIYSQSFGKMPQEALQIGARIEACGDYITSNTNGEYPPSPDGAILHWVHKSGNPNHDSGYVMINDVLYGYGPGKNMEEALVFE